MTSRETDVMWKLVPVEPTSEMVAAMAVEEASGSIDGVKTIGMAGAVVAYGAALAAAPQPPAQPAGGEREELIDWLNQSADQAAIFHSTAHEAKRYRQAAALLAADGKAGGEAVYLVATGEVYEGQETYTRHDARPPLCEAETLYTRPQQAADGKAGGEVAAALEWAAELSVAECPQSGDWLYDDREELAKAVRAGITRHQPAAQVAQPLTGHAIYTMVQESWKELAEPEFIRQMYNEQAAAFISLVRSVEAEVLRSITGDGRGEAACKECGGYGWVPNLDSEGKRIWGPLMNDALPCKCGALAKRIAAEKASRPPQQEQAATGTIVFVNPSYEPWLRRQAAPGAVQDEKSDLYWRLHSLSKALEGSGRIDQHDMPDAYATILDAMANEASNVP